MRYSNPCIQLHTLYPQEAQVNEERTNPDPCLTVRAPVRDELWFSSEAWRLQKRLC